MRGQRLAVTPQVVHDQSSKAERDDPDPVDDGGIEAVIDGRGKGSTKVVLPGDVESPKGKSTRRLKRIFPKRKSKTNRSALKTVHEEVAGDDLSR